MKKIILVVAAHCIAATMNAQDGFVIKGKLAGQGNQKLSLGYVDENKQLVKDTNIVATDNSFTIQGDLLNGPVVAYLNTRLDRNIYMAKGKKGMFIPAPALEVVISNNNQLKITGTAEDIHLATVKGDRLNESFNKMRKAEYAVVKEIWKLQQQSAELKINGDKEGSAKLVYMIGALRERKTAVRKQFIKSNPAEFASMYMLSSMGSDYDTKELEEAYDNLDDAFKKTSYAKIVAAKIEAGKATALGKPAPGFTKPDVNGNPLDLASLKGKYVLVDFWGSWCGPCRASHPHLKEVYAKYKDKGFEILAVANEKIDDPDKARAAWKNAIEKDGISWLHVINNEGREQTDVVKLYGIEGFPTKLLLDKEGKIISKWVGMENVELDAKLKAIFGE